MKVAILIVSLDLFKKDIDFSLPKPISMSDQSFTMQVQEEVFDDDGLVKGVEKLFVTTIDKEDMILKISS